MGSNLWRWQNGRRAQLDKPGTYYQKFLIFQIPDRMDCWLIKYARAVGIGWHTDKVPGKKHYRINIVLRKGGEFWIEGKKIDRRFIFFRPDIQKHCVKVFGRNQRRLIFSIGWVR